MFSHGARLVLLTALCLVMAAISFAMPVLAEDTAQNDSLLPPVELTLTNSRGQSVRLMIPSAYVKKRGSGEYLNVHYPDMQPQSGPTWEQVVKALEEKGQPAALDNITKKWELDKPKYDSLTPLNYDGIIYVSDGIPEFPENMIDRELSRYPEYEDPYEPEFRHYRHSEKDGTVVREYLIPREEFEARSIWIDCLPRDESRPDLGCFAKTSLGDRLILSYSIPRGSIASWREIDKRVRAFVRQLVVDCFEGAVLETGQHPLSTHACQF